MTMLNDCQRDAEERKGLCATLKEAEDAAAALALACDPVVRSVTEERVLVCCSE